MEENNRSIDGETSIVDSLKTQVYKLPELMERGLKLVYPENQMFFIKILLEDTRNGTGIYIEDAFNVMEKLEDGASIEEAYAIIKDYSPMVKGIINSMVLRWSKRGPEYYRAVLPIPFERLSKDDQRYVKAIENNNQIYKENAAARERNHNK